MIHYLHNSLFSSTLPYNSTYFILPKLSSLSSQLHENVVPCLGCPFQCHGPQRLSRWLKPEQLQGSHDLSLSLDHKPSLSIGQFLKTAASYFFQFFKFLRQEDKSNASYFNITRRGKPTVSVSKGFRTT